MGFDELCKNIIFQLLCVFSECFQFSYMCVQQNLTTNNNLIANFKQQHGV